ncbi:MAG: hypothetical protein KDD58_07360, partial [Bdellovibrionales bacterium]|nr:hypothetical protein [Bdellovibrionales bacterium]
MKNYFLLLLLIFNLNVLASKDPHSFTGYSLGWPKTPVSLSPNLDTDQSPPGHEPEKPPLSDIENELREIIQSIPNGNLQTGLEKYIEILGLGAYRSHGDVDKSNRGLSEYLRRSFSDGKCFQEIVKDFYGEIKKMDRKHRKYKLLNAVRDTLQKTHSLQDEAGRGEHVDVSKG